MNYSITNAKLDTVRQIPTLNHGGPFKKLRFLVMHYTAGPSLDGTIETFSHTERAVSAHLVIGRDGNIVQMVPFDKVAWHAGVSSWSPPEPTLLNRGLTSLNFYAIGIEMVNAGPLTRAQDGIFHAWWGGAIPPSEVIEVDPAARGSFGKRFWHRYPAEQLAAAQDVARALVSTYKLEDVLGHSDIAPGRKIDPGAAFPMASFKATLFGRA
jgi:N-acetylmuramoyl-L-alanine amidase